MPSSFSKIVGVSVLFAALGSGCVATVRARPAYAVYDDYPHTHYEGRTVYYFDGYWHHRAGDRWIVAYRQEPRSLYQYRVRRAPSAPRTYERDHRHQHDGHRHPVRRSAPPADRY